MFGGRYGAGRRATTIVKALGLSAFDECAKCVALATHFAVSSTLSICIAKLFGRRHQQILQPLLRYPETRPSSWSWRSSGAPGIDLSPTRKCGVPLTPSCL